MTYDVVIIGGGPAGLAAALLLGRARKRVLLCDAGPRRNAAARAIQGFVTRDGTPPSEFRRIARTQLTPYRSVETRDVLVQDVRAAPDGFDIDVEDAGVRARRVLLCTGMVDDLPPLPGFRALWGHSVFQCPYCHAWEVRGLAFGYLAPRASSVDWALLLRAWTDDVMVFTDGRFTVPEDKRQRLATAGIPLEERPVAGLIATDADATSPPELTFVDLTDGTRIPRRVLFAHPPQRQTVLVERLGLARDDDGYLEVDADSMTSTSGIHAAGDLTTARQSATLAAAAGARAAAAINQALTVEDALSQRVP